MNLQASIGKRKASKARKYLLCDVMGDFEDSMSTGSLSVDHSLGDSLSVELCELVNQMHVLEEDGSSGSSGL